MAYLTWYNYINMSETKAFYLLISTSLLTVLSPGLYGVLGSLGYYLHDILQAKDTFSWGRFSIYIFLGFTIALMVNDLALLTIKASYPGLMIASGFSVRRVVRVADKWLDVAKIK